jgi:hypothetical protein
MDNNPKTAAEELAQGISMIEKSFFKIKSEYEHKLTPDQKIEYEKLSKEKGINKAIDELKDKMEQLKTMKI